MLFLRNWSGGRGRWENDDSTDFRTGRVVSFVSGCNCSAEADQGEEGGEEEDFKDDCQNVGGLEVARAAGQEAGLERTSGKNVWEPINLALYQRVDPTVFFCAGSNSSLFRQRAFETDEP